MRKKVIGFLLSLGIAFCTALIVLSVTALVIAKTGVLPQGGMAALCATLAICTGVFVGSFLGSLIIGEKGIIVGSANGLVFVGLLVVGALFLFDSSLTPGGGGRLAAVFLSGCVGGIMGVNRKQKVKF